MELYWGLFFGFLGKRGRARDFLGKQKRTPEEIVPGPTSPPLILFDLHGIWKDTFSVPSYYGDDRLPSVGVEVTITHSPNTRPVPSSSS